MLRITDLVLARGVKRLLDGANLTVHPGHKVGLVGPNGCGKSSLFALILGDAHQDAGSVELPSSWTIAHVAQETPAVATPAIEFVQDGDRELREIEQGLAAAEAAAASDPERQGELLALLHHRFEDVGGYSARARAAMLLSGLGFPAASQGDSVASFSGGWRMRLNLAQALMCRSDLLLLDEPTNHLDLDAVLWLEDWLARYTGTLLLVTHDRDFLDGVVTGIVHFDAKKLRSYSGNYSQFEARARAAARAAAGDLREAAAADRASDGVRRPLPRQGHEGEAGAEPDQGARANGEDRGGARRQPIRVHVPDGERCRAAARAARARDPRLPRAAAGSRGARLGHPQRRPHRAPGTQRRRQVDTAEGDRRNARAACRRAAHRAGARNRLLRATPGRAAARRGVAALAPREDRSGSARAGAQGLPRRIRLSRRHGHASGRAVLRRRKGPADARAARPPETQPAAARRADQPPRHRNARGARRSTAGLRRRAGRGRARPPSAPRHDGCVVAGRRRPRRAVRRRPRRLSRLGARPEPATRGRR